MIEIIFALALSLQDAPPANAVPTDKEADEAVVTLKKSFADSGEQGRIAAIREACKVKHETVIRAVSAVLTNEPETVRVAAALALGDVDHPSSAQALMSAIGPNEQKALVLSAVARALGKLQWQSCVPQLNGIVKKVGDADIRPAMPEVLDALGAIGSVSSVDPILDLFEKLSGPRREPWANEGQILGSARRALSAITGGDTSSWREFRDWWKDNKAKLLQGAKTTWWVKATQQRVECGVGEKPPADSVQVAQRITDAPQPKPERGAKQEGERKKKDK